MPRRKGTADVTRADDVIDRRRLRRKLAFWRVAAIVVLLIGVFFVADWYYGDRIGAVPDHIALVKIDGTITENEDLLDRLDRIDKSPSVKGVILNIDSPGGTTVGGEATFEAVRKIAADKPVVAEVGTLAASAGYMIATAADHIVARQTSIVGSIGVLIQYPDVTGLMDKLGIKLEEVKSAPLKAEPSPFNQTTDEERAMIRHLIMDSYDWFVNLVAERRRLPREDVLKLADGSIFTGRQAVENKLIDEVGGKETAKKWLEGKGVDPDLKVIEWKPKRGEGRWYLPGFAGKAAASLLGLTGAGDELLERLGADRVLLDGMLSVWHPDPVHLPD